MRLLPSLMFILALTCKTILASSQEKEEIFTYNLDKVDTLVDIGCGDGSHDKAIVHYYPNLYLILEDLTHDTKHHDIKKSILRTLKNSPYTPNIENNFSFVSGTDDSISLATSQYKMVLCRKALHEFVNKEKMVEELERILSKDGILIIVEAEPKFEGETDPYCKRQYLNKSEVINSFRSLKLLEEKSIDYDKRKLSVFKFAK